MYAVERAPEQGDSGSTVCLLLPVSVGKDEASRATAEFIALAHNAFNGDPEALAWWEENRRKR